MQIVEKIAWIHSYESCGAVMSATTGRLHRRVRILSADKIHSSEPCEKSVGETLGRLAPYYYLTALRHEGAARRIPMEATRSPAGRNPRCWEPPKMPQPRWGAARWGGRSRETEGG